MEFESKGEVLPLGGWGIKDVRIDRDTVACSIQKASWKNRSMMTRFQMKWGSLVWTTCFCDMYVAEVIEGIAAFSRYYNSCGLHTDVIRK